MVLLSKMTFCHFWGCPFLPKLTFPNNSVIIIKACLWLSALVHDEVSASTWCNVIIMVNQDALTTLTCHTPHVYWLAHCTAWTTLTCQMYAVTIPYGHSDPNKLLLCCNETTGRDCFLLSYWKREDKQLNLEPVNVK